MFCLCGALAPRARPRTCIGHSAKGGKTDDRTQRLIPRPQLTEIDRVDVAASAVDVWELLRRGELAHSRPIRALFRLRTVTSRAGRASPTIRIDSLRSTPSSRGSRSSSMNRRTSSRLAPSARSGASTFRSYTSPTSRPSPPSRGRISSRSRGPSASCRGTAVSRRVRVGSRRPTKPPGVSSALLPVIGPFSRFIRHSLLRGLARAAAPSHSAPGGMRW